MGSRKYMHNGLIVDESQLPNAFESRGFLYADGFFETIRCVEVAYLFSIYITQEFQKVLRHTRWNFPIGCKSVNCREF